MTSNRLLSTMDVAGRSWVVTIDIMCEKRDITMLSHPISSALPTPDAATPPTCAAHLLLGITRLPPGDAGLGGVGGNLGDIGLGCGMKSEFAFVPTRRRH
mmetsp:Transcript_34443/g.56298  ORF Transcript_34443/g.56298 Transcript_34443/m.56298 type:complete len:100 (-) Transcript_34443:300-599(-)